MGLNSGIRSPVVLSPGGGGGNAGIPLGPYANWAALPVTAEAGALAVVTSLGPGNATGTAIWSGTEWELYRGIFDSVADLLAFAEPIQTGGVGSVEETGDTNENQVVYVYDGAAWARSSALSVGYVWALNDFVDFAPIGLRDGDFGLWVPTNSAPIILRYKSACSFAGGGTLPVWLTPISYAGTPILQAWTAGTENNTVLAAQGWTIVNDAGCTVTATGGFQRFSAAGAGGASARLRCMVGTIAAATRMEALIQARATMQADALIYAPFLADGTKKTVWGQNATNPGLGFSAGSLDAPQNTPARNGANAALPTIAQDAATCIVRDEGRTVFSSATVNGLPFATYRRDLRNEGANLIQVSVASFVVPASTFDFRGQILTY